MKFKTIRETVQVPHTRDGHTVMVDKQRDRLVPVLPPDWDAAAVRAVFGVVLALTLVSMVWSTVSIAHLLGGTWVAYLAAAVFDLSWMTALGLAYIARNRPERRALPDRLGWVLLAVTVGALATEGALSGGWPMACVGSAVSIVAKSLWWAAFRTTEADMSPEDQAWVASVISEAGAKIAVASARRAVARMEDRAAAELLALEAARQVPTEVTLQRSADTGPVPEVPEVVPPRELETRARDMADLLSTLIQTATPDQLDWVREAVQSSRPVPQDKPTDVPQESPSSPADAHRLAKVLPGADTAAGTSTGTTQDPGAEVPQVDESAVRSVRHLRPVRGASTAAIRDLIGRGVIEVPAIRDHLQDSGLHVPDASYIRRLIRDARTPEVPEGGTGQYL